MKLPARITACTVARVVKGSEAFHRRPPGAPPPCRGCASWPTARLHNAFGQFTVAACERQAPTRGAPSGSAPAAGRGERAPFTPLRCHGFREGSRAATNPRRGIASLSLTRLNAACFLGLVPARFLRTFWGALDFAVLHTFLRLVATRDSAAGPPVRRRWGWPHFGSAWGPSRGPCGRPSHPLGRVVPGSVTSNLAIHVTRTGGRSAGADLAA